MKNLNLKIKKLNECKTFSEIYEVISEKAINMCSYYVLVFLIFIPSGTMLILNTFNIKIDFLYLLFLAIGYIGDILTIFLMCRMFYKRNNYLFYLKQYPYNFFLLLFLFFAVISAFNAFHKSLAFNGNTYRHEGLLMYIAYGGLFGMSISLKEEKRRIVIINCFCLVGSILSLLTILQVIGYNILFFNKDTGLSAIFYNTNHFAYFLTMTIICTATFLVLEIKIKYKIFYIVQFLIMSIALVLNNTFGCYLAVLFGLVFLIIIFYLIKFPLRNLTLIPLLLFVAISIFTNEVTDIISNNFNTLTTDLSGIGTKGENDDIWMLTAGSGRWSLWINTIEFIKEKPLLGYGLDNLSYEYEKVGIDMDRPHNEYLQHAAQIGIPGLVFYICAIASIYIKAFIHRKNLSPTTLVALCAVGAYLLSALFGNTMFYTTPYFMMLLGMSTKIGNNEESIE